MVFALQQLTTIFFAPALILSLWVATVRGDAKVRGDAEVRVSVGRGPTAQPILRGQRSKLLLVSQDSLVLALPAWGSPTILRRARASYLARLCG